MLNSFEPYTPADDAEIIIIQQNASVRQRLTAFAGGIAVSLAALIGNHIVSSVRTEVSETSSSKTPSTEPVGQYNDNPDFLRDTRNEPLPDSGFIKPAKLIVSRIRDNDKIEFRDLGYIHPREAVQILLRGSLDAEDFNDIELGLPVLPTIDEELLNTAQRIKAESLETSDVIRDPYQDNVDLSRD